MTVKEQPDFKKVSERARSNFINAVFEIFLEEYKNNRQFDYVASPEDLKYVEKLMQIYKDSRKGVKLSVQDYTDYFRNLFRRVCNTRHKQLRILTSPKVIAKNINKVLTIIHDEEAESYRMVM